jgi:glycosyltransferase involved in cell wall biosynthesis
MTLAMWFVWLLRSDIRNGATPSDVQAQREFMCWWLLWGRREYPRVFSWSRKHADIAMELVALENGLLCPQLLIRLYSARADLQKAYPLTDLESLAEYFCWYRLHGPLELAAAPPLPKPCLALTEEPSKRDPWCLDGTKVPRIAVALSRSKPELLEGDINDPEARRALIARCMAVRRSVIPKPTPPVRLRLDAPRGEVLRNDGVNVIGFVARQSGLGEDVRMISTGLSAAGMAHVVINAAEQTQIAHAQIARMPICNDPKFAISIYSMSAFDMATLYLRRGARFLANQYRIGYWPWELPRFPDIWADVYELVDEIWTGSEFTAKAYRTNCTKPVNRVPAPVTVPAVRRRTLGISSAFVFMYPLDPNSYLARKNPIALVRAFHSAFTVDDREVALVLRVNGTIPEGPDRRALFREIGTDERIVVMEGGVDRTVAFSLTASCDCLVSPHRAEGFGRNIAEAILLRVPVLATAYSGCEDFLESDEGLAFELREVRPGEYPFGEGLLWADPLIDDMAEKMKRRRALMRRQAGKERKRLSIRAEKLADTYGPQIAGRAFAERISALRQQLIGRRNASDFSY